MDNKKLKGIVDIFNDSGLTFMEINEKEGENAFSIKLEKKGEILPVPASAHAAPQFSAAEPAASDTEREIKDFNKYRDVKSPMVGIFYTSPSPDSEPFIKVGDKVKKGDTVSAGQTIGKVGSVSCECAEESHIHLEVMQDDRYLDPVKDVVAEEDGELVEICAENGSLVEFGQVLFKIF